MQRMTDVLSRMLNDPMTRAALSAGGEDSLDSNEQHLENREGDNLIQEGAGAANNMDVEQNEQGQSSRYE